MDILTLGKMNQLAKDLDQGIATLTESTDIALQDVCDTQVAIGATQAGQVQCLDTVTQSGVDVLTALGGGSKGTNEEYFYNPNSGSCCCFSGMNTTWTVPDGVKTITFEAWGGGGAGAGHCCQGCLCSMASCGSSGGAYARKTISVDTDFAVGDQYSICVGDGGNGGSRCWTACCDAPRGCASYVNGNGLSNYCAVGGKGGYNIYCHCLCNHTARRQESAACLGMVMGTNVDFAATAEVGEYNATGRPNYCRCSGRFTKTGPSYKLPNALSQHIADSNAQCGCINACNVKRFAGGGLNSQKTYCGNYLCNCLGTPGQAGLVVITYS